MAIQKDNRCEEAISRNSQASVVSRFCRAAIGASLMFGVSAALADSGLPEGGTDSVIDDTVRIIGGNKAPAGKWPSMVALVNSTGTTLFNRQFCGGTKVADRWVMTAAHCLYDFSGNLRTAGSLKVVGGITDLADASALEVDVLNVIVHPSYQNSASNPMHDIALLELSSDLGEGVDAVPLYTQPQESLVGVNAAIVGWGAVDLTNGQPSYPTLLQEAVVPVVSQAQCNAPESYDGFVQDGQMCAGYRNGGIDSCSGDSGGPLFVQIDNVVHQAGVTSFGNGCAEANFYGVYSEVAHFNSWLAQYLPDDAFSDSGDGDSIQQQVDGFEPSNRSSAGAAWGVLMVLVAGAAVRRRRI